MTAAEFEAKVAGQRGITIEELRAELAVLTCNCGEPECEGWIFIPKNIVDDWLEVHPGRHQYPPNA